MLLNYWEILAVCNHMNIKPSISREQCITFVSIIFKIMALTQRILINFMIIMATTSLEALADFQIYMRNLKALDPG